MTLKIQKIILEFRYYVAVVVAAVVDVIVVVIVVIYLFRNRFG